MLQVHYFVLGDIEARGFARRFAVCYVSYNPDKIMTYFLTLRDEINK